MSDVSLQTGGFPWLSLVIWLPLVGTTVLVVLRESQVRWAALGVAAADFVFSLPLWLGFDTATTAMQFGERAVWISSPPIHYALGIDGISLPLILLTTFLTPFCVLVSWRAIETRVKEYMAALLVMETAMLGVFAALDFVLFYVFWEVMLIPMYLIIGVWGGPNRIYAAIKFFLYTLAGSLLLLVAIIVLYFQGGQTFDILRAARQQRVVPIDTRQIEAAREALRAFGFDATKTREILQKALGPGVKVDTTPLDRLQAELRETGLVAKQTEDEVEYRVGRHGVVPCVGEIAVRSRVEFDRMDFGARRHRGKSPVLPTTGGGSSPQGDFDRGRGPGAAGIGGVGTFPLIPGQG